ncbi:MAG: RNA polymerase-binding protein DksA [Dongiaceae bacterium]
MTVITLPPNYKPSPKEEYMNPQQLEYFRQKLLAWKEEILQEAEHTVHNMQEESLQQPDMVDRASVETDMAIELRARDRQRKLISKIDEALQRIESGEYGYCEETGQPIGLPRLEARPVATLSLEAQERHERHERTHRDEEY